MRLEVPCKLGSTAPSSARSLGPWPHQPPPSCLCHRLPFCVSLRLWTENSERPPVPVVFMTHFRGDAGDVLTRVISTAPSSMTVAPSVGDGSPQPHLPGGSCSSRQSLQNQAEGPADRRPGCWGTERPSRACPRSYPRNTLPSSPRLMHFAVSRMCPHPLICYRCQTAGTGETDNTTHPFYRQKN